MEEIEEFCKLNYGVTFDLFEKLHAKGEEIHPLYAWLTSQTEPQGEVQWNFEKFLISKEGQPIKRYNSQVTPDDPNLMEDINKALQ
jgi:glutathione peroxidase